MCDCYSVGKTFLYAHNNVKVKVCDEEERHKGGIDQNTNNKVYIKTTIITSFK